MKDKTDYGWWIKFLMDAGYRLWKKMGKDSDGWWMMNNVYDAWWMKFMIWFVKFMMDDVYSSLLMVDNVYCGLRIKIMMDKVDVG